MPNKVSIELEYMTAIKNHLRFLPSEMNVGVLVQKFIVGKRSIVMQCGSDTYSFLYLCRNIQKMIVIVIIVSANFYRYLTVDVIHSQIKRRCMNNHSVPNIRNILVFLSVYNPHPVVFFENNQHLFLTRKQPDNP